MREGEVLQIRTSGLQLWMPVTVASIQKVRAFLKFVEDELDVPLPLEIQNAGRWETVMENKAP